MAALQWPEGQGAGDTRTVRVAGTTVRIRELGSGDPVLLLHGFADSLDTWRHTVPALARSHRVIAVDLPGFGESRAVAHRPLVAWYGHFVEELIGELAPRRRVTLVGNSLGGAVALDVALRRPLRVSKLVLVGCAGLGDGVPLWWKLVTAQIPMLPPLASPAAAALPRALLQRVVGQVYGALVFHRAAALDRDCLNRFASYYPNARDVRRLFEMGHTIVRELSTGRLIREAPALQTPTLLVWGRHDRLVPLAHAHAMQRLVPSARLYVMDECGHSPQLEHPAEFSGAVERFLRGRTPGGGARVLAGPLLPD